MKMSTILVVDDDATIRFVLKMILEEAGHEVVEAAHGAAVFDVIGPQHLPDVVMTDLAMPVLRGEELIRRLRSEAPTAAIPIVVVSGDAVKAWTLKASGLVDAVVPKPFDAVTLTRCIQDVANRANRPSIVA